MLARFNPSLTSSFICNIYVHGMHNMIDSMDSMDSMDIASSVHTYTCAHFCRTLHVYFF
jgi:hypothetical protein